MALSDNDKGNCPKPPPSHHIPEARSATSTNTSKPRPQSPSSASTYTRWRSQARKLLSSQTNQALVFRLVALDVTAIQAGNFMARVAVEEPWMAKTRGVLQVFGLVYSTVFAIELIVTVWAFGWR